MLKLNEISDEELNTYIKDQFGQTPEYINEQRRGDKISLIKSIVGDLKKAITHFNTLENVLKNRAEEYVDIGEIQNDSISEINNAFNRAIKKSHQLFQFLGWKKDTIKLDVKQGDIEFKKIEDVIYIKFPSLLPCKNEVDVKKFHTQYNLIHSLYEEPFKKFFFNIKNRIYDDKVVICFIHFYKNEDRLVDLDNMETKPIIDLITAYTLLDDSPKYCSLYMDYKISDNEHTEVVVMPKNKFVIAFAMNFMNDK